MLNPHLIKAPKECIDYVILHELCHIAEHNHSERFWRLLTSVMPHWREVKSRLDGMAELYLNEQLERELLQARRLALNQTARYTAE